MIGEDTTAKKVSPVFSFSGICLDLFDNWQAYTAKQISTIYLPRGSTVLNSIGIQNFMTHMTLTQFLLETKLDLSVNLT